MSEIVEVLNEIVERHDCSHPAIVSKASAEITRLTAEVEREKTYGTTMHAEWEKQREENARVKAENERLWEAKRGTDNVTSRLTAENKKLKAALRECEAELNAYYRMEYPGDHPYNQKKLAKAMASNPATVALSGDKQ